MSNLLDGNFSIIYIICRNLRPLTLNLEPMTLHPKSYTLHPKPYILNSKSLTPNHEP